MEYSNYHSDSSTLLCKTRIGSVNLYLNNIYHCLDWILGHIHDIPDALCNNNSVLRINIDTINYYLEESWSSHLCFVGNTIDKSIDPTIRMETIAYWMSHCVQFEYVKELRQKNTQYVKEIRLLLTRPNRELFKNSIWNSTIYTDFEKQKHIPIITQMMIHEYIFSSA